MEYMTREEQLKHNIEVFEDTLEMCESEMLASAIKNSLENVKVYTGYDVKKTIKFKASKIELSTFGTFERAVRVKKLTPDQKVAVLNFADQLTPGGLVKYGEVTQEENLCRLSTLYPVLSRFDEESKYKGTSYTYKAANKEFKELGNYQIPKNELRYIPEIKIIKFPTSENVMPEPMDVGVISMAAPFPDVMPEDETKILEENNGWLNTYYVPMIRTMIYSAIENNVDVLILGAWGCGAFGNDPMKMALAFKQVIEELGNIEKVIFAIKCKNPEESVNYQTFERVFKR